MLLSYVLNAVRLTLICGLIAACAPTGKQSGSDQGGVDGSGGNLTTAEFNEFNVEVQNVREQIRDVVYRWRVVRSHTTQKPWLDIGDPERTYNLGVFGALQPQTIDKLVGTQEEIDALLKRTEFFAQPGPCPAEKGHTSDASVINGRVCFSYEAFKRFDRKERRRQLVILGMHEFAHLRGFGESTAVSVQDFFSYYQRALILTENQEYNKAKTELLFELAISLDVVVKDSARRLLNATYCSRLVDYAYGDSTKTRQMLQLPVHIANQLQTDSPLNKTITEMDKHCRSRNLRGVVTVGLQALDQITGVYADLVKYESSLCADGTCGSVVMNAETRLKARMWLEGSKKSVNAKSCQILSPTTGEPLPLVEKIASTDVLGMPKTVFKYKDESASFIVDQYKSGVLVKFDGAYAASQGRFEINMHSASYGEAALLFQTTASQAADVLELQARETDPLIALTSSYDGRKALPQFLNRTYKVICK